MKNGGILNPVYRHEKKEGCLRQRKNWFNTYRHISVQVLKEKLVELIGEECPGLFDNLLSRERG